MPPGISYVPLPAAAAAPAGMILEEKRSMRTLFYRQEKVSKIIARICGQRDGVADETEMVEGRAKSTFRAHPPVMWRSHTRRSGA
jgi:hypothetical protein